VETSGRLPSDPCLSISSKLDAMSVIKPGISAHAPALGETRWRATVGAVDVCFGVGERARLPSIVTELGACRPLIITDPGVRATGLVDELGAALMQLGCACAVFDDVQENPSTACVESGTEAARRHEVDLLIGFGGGSAMDTAKGVNFLYSNGGCMEDYEGTGKAHAEMLPSIGVPTTAGTGSEAQSYALISRLDDHRKMACGDPGARFRAAVLDPGITGTVPRDVRVATGIDAVSHALESLVSSRANPISRLYSREAWHLLAAGFEPAVATPEDLDARGQMLLGAHLAGAAIERSMLGAAHACANPLTAQFGITHGIAVGVMLPYIVRYNLASDAAATEYDVLEINDLPEYLTAILGTGKVAARLRDHAVPQASLVELAAQAAQQWTANFNPRPVDASTLLGIYESAY